MNNSRRNISADLALVNAYTLESREGRTLGEVVSEYDCFEVSYLGMLQEYTGVSDDTVITGGVRTMKIVRLKDSLTTRQAYEALRKARLRPVNWIGALIFGAQYPARALAHNPIALGGKPHIQKWYRGSKNAFYAQIRPEHNGYHRKDLTIQVACPDPKTGRWDAGTCFLVTDLP